jgi:hypothetical protein
VVFLSSDLDEQAANATAINSIIAHFILAFIQNTPL